MAPPSAWLRDAGPIEPLPALEGSRHAEICIVGGGFTGLWTALRIKQLEPDREVVVLEADVCGSGASGRNGGFVLTFWHHFSSLERICGGSEAVRLARASEASVRDIGSFCEEHGIDAQYRPEGWMWAATNTAQVGAWDSTIAAIERHGEHPFERLEPDEVVARTGSPAHLAGVFERISATVQPARLARGLLRVAGELGVTVYERSPMVGLERSTTLAVRTRYGRITADRVLITMGAWSAQMHELRNAFVVVASDIALSNPVPEERRREGWPGGMAISDSRLMVHYYRATVDGRIAFGKGSGRLALGARIGDSLQGRSPVESDLVTRMLSVWPSIAAAGLDCSWAGPIDRTIDGMPFFHAVGRPDLIAGAGFSGNGVGPSALAGRVLASMALDRSDEWSQSGLVRRPPAGMPPEPLRYVGGTLVRAAVARKERAEDAGHPPKQLDVALARLAPSGLVPTR
jgi:glycine/D-amino acid oxidase-like deaminating enzyme